MCGCTNGCNTGNTSVLPIGPAGTNGIDGIDGTNGTNGINGTTILFAYNNTTGVGTPASLVETTLATYTMPANTISVNGDEIELYAFFDYLSLDVVTIRVKLNGLNSYSFTYSAAENSKILLRIRIARINATSQLWTIERIHTLAVTPPSTLLVTSNTTTEDLTASMTIAISGQNSVANLNEINLKKLTITKHKQ